MNKLNAMEQNRDHKTSFFYFRLIEDENFFARFLEEEKNKMNVLDSLLCLERFDEIDEALSSYEEN